MIFLTTVMDEEETNTNNSVEHYDDHGCKPVRQTTRPRSQACMMMMSISQSQRLLAFTMTNVQLSTAQGSYGYSLRRVV